PGEPDASVALEFVNQRINRAGGHRVSTHEQGMERQGLAQLVVAHEPRDYRVDRTPGLVSGQMRCSAQHRLEIEKRDRPELFVALGVNPFGIPEEATIAFEVL